MAIIREYPLTPLQLGMYFQHHVADRAGIDVVQVVGDIRHAIEPDSFERAWNDVVRDHEALRTAICSVPGQEPTAKIFSEAVAQIDFHDLTNLNREAQIQHFQEAEQLERQRPFDLASPPLMRWALFKLTEEHWRMLWTWHHIVLDGRSCILLLKQVFSHYEADLNGQYAPSMEQVAFGEYAQRVARADIGPSVEFWRKRLHAGSAATPLRLQKPDSVPSRRMECRTLFSTELTSQLRALGDRDGFTFNTVVQAAWAIVLSRYTGETGVVFGATRTTRKTIPGGDGMIGPLIATVPVLAQVNGDLPVVGLLRSLRDDWVSGRGHEHVPLPVLQGMTGIPSNQRMFDSLVSGENETFGKSLTLPGGEWNKRTFELFSMETGYLLTVLASGGENLELRILFDASQVERGLVDRLLGHLQVVLESIAADSEQKLSQLQLLTKAELAKLAKWNVTQPEYPRDQHDERDTLVDESSANQGQKRPSLIHDHFERQASKTPGATAIIDGTRRITYEELNRRANQIAHYLQSKSIAADTLVGIFLRRSPDLVAAILGVLKAGGAYVPIDTNYPKERIQNILDDSRVSVLLTESALEQRVPRSAAKIFCLDTQHEALDKWPIRNLEIHTEPENLAYVLFTSGSTGRPKGVAIEHRNTATFIEWCIRTFATAELAGVAFGTSVCFDMSTFEMFVTLAAGGKVIVLENLLDLTSVQAKDEVTCINTVPSAMAELVRAGSVPKSVKLILLAGEALPHALAQDILEHTCVERLFNLYGPTETGYSTFELVEKNRPITIGRPISNLKAYLLDAQQRPVPIGVIGEIYIGGSGVARGYCNQPELTAERFLPNPFADQPGARMYKTGDLGRFLEDGRIEYLGRIDHQVKIRGFRVELGEIEAIVSEHPGVVQAVAIVREDQPGNKQIVAYVTTNAGDEVSADHLLSQVAPRLPDYMRPAAIVMLDRIPLTPNGKVDRAALPAPSPRTVSHSQSLPSGSTETEIARIWEEVLGRKDIGAVDNFFVLGGHSLSAARVMSRIQHAFEIEIPLRAMFDSPTIRGLSTRVLEAKCKHRLPLLQRLDLKRAPCSFAQQRLWLSTQIVGSNDAFNVPFVTRVRGPLNIDMLEEALSSVASRHESLRTTFDSAGEEVVQVIHDSVSIPINLIELSALKGPDRQSRCDEVILGELAKGFDLASGPLLRVTVIRLEPGDHVLVIVMHHMITDGWSLAILLEELSSFYTALSEGKEAQLSDLKIQYSDFAVWQREWLSAEILEKQTKHWMKVLEGVTPLISLPSDRPRPVVQSHSGATCQSTIDERLTAKLKGLSQECNATLMMTLLASFQLLLSKYSGDQDITVGTDLAYRNSIETEKLIGFFVGVLPIRTKLNGDPEFRELIDRVRSASLDMYAHQDVALDKLVDALNLERTLSYNPLVQVLFVMQNTPDIVLNIPGHKTEPFRVPITRSKFDLLLFVKEANNSLILDWLYSTDLFESKTVKSMTEHYETLLRSVSVDPNLRLSNIDYRSELERERLRSDKMQDRLKKQSQLKLVKRKSLDR